MAQVLSLTDLNTTVNHEPRIHDLRVAAALGMRNTHSIRTMIESNIQELQNYGQVSQQRRETSSKGGRPSVDYYLNEAQCLLICMFSRTKQAVAVRKAIIDVYMEYRQKQLGERITTVKTHQRRLPVIQANPNQLALPALNGKEKLQEIAKHSLKHVQQQRVALTHMNLLINNIGKNLGDYWHGEFTRIVQCIEAERSSSESAILAMQSFVR